MQTRNISKVRNNKEELLSQIDKLESLLMEFETGRKLIMKAEEMALTEERIVFESTINDNNLSQEEIDRLNYYFAQMCKKSPERSMQMFANYIVELAFQPEYLERAEIYLSLAIAARSVCETVEYYHYADAVHRFNKDMSEKAITAKNAIAEFEQKIEKLMN